MRWRLAGVIAAADLRRRARERTLLATGILGPFALALIISLAFSSGGGDLRIGVQDLDRSPTSTGLVEGLAGGATEDDSGLTVEVIEPSSDVDAVASSEDGPASIIVVPDGFADSLGTDAPTPLVVVADDSDAFSAEIATAIARSVAAEVDRTRLLIATGATATGAPPTADLLDAAAEAVPAVTAGRSESDDSYSAASYFAPAMAMFFLFFTLGTGASALIADRRTGVLARMRATPTGDTTIIVGRAGGVVGLGLVSTITLWAVSGPVMGANWGPPLGALVVIVCVVLAITGLAMLVMAFARTESQVAGATSILGFGMAFAGGTFFSTAQLPPLLQSMSLLTPNGLAQRGFTELALGTSSLADIWWVPAGLLAMAAISGSAALVVIRQRVLT